MYLFHGNFVAFKKPLCIMMNRTCLKLILRYRLGYICDAFKTLF